MVICPKCGAANKEGSPACRMCATPLEAVGDKSARDEMIMSLPPTVVIGEQKIEQTPMNSAKPTEIECPKCQTKNEFGWAFCQQCGSRLPSSAPEPVRTEPAPTEPAPTEPARPEQFRPEPARPEPPRPEPPRPEPVRPAPEPRFPQGLKTVESESLRVKANMPPAVPRVPNEPPAAPPAPPAAQKFNTPPAGSQPAQGSEPTQPSQPAGRAAGGVPCPQCGHSNVPGSAYCAGCGASMMVAKTIVMSSQVAPVKGRLHLVMEGGQQGEVYDLGDETVIGRTNGDITFPHDGFMSGRHAQIVRRGNTFLLTDEGSRNGTFIKIKKEVELKPGDMILVGKQLFRFEV
jgi:hypothetical protein